MVPKPLMESRLRFREISHTCKPWGLAGTPKWARLCFEELLVTWMPPLSSTWGLREDTGSITGRQWQLRWAQPREDRQCCSSPDSPSSS